MEELGKLLEGLKSVLYGEGEQEPKKQDIQDVAKEAYANDLLLLLVQNIQLLEFESRRHASQIFNNLLKVQINNKYTTVEYISLHVEILTWLLNGYAKNISFC